MKLFEHPDFEQAIIHATEHFRPQGLREAFIEKDYYVTECLRIVQDIMGDKVIFKGGTSLSKGWGIIKRFSEDIDLFLDPTAFSPTLGKNAINRELKQLRQSIEDHPGLKFLEIESKTIGGFGRSDYFEYSQKFKGFGEIQNRVLLEAGTASGKEPVVKVKLQSYIGQFLTEKGITLGTSDEHAFEMNLLHFRRTFVEKMFAIHGKVEAFKRQGIPIGGYARHYYDLFCLVQYEEVLKMLSSSEYQEIKSDYDRISRQYFKQSYVAPINMCFANSEALFPKFELEQVLAKEFEKQCRILCFGSVPTWKQVQYQFEDIRELL